MIILQNRTIYAPEFTESELYITNTAPRFSYVLEDQQQLYGVKIAGETCIPEGIYTVAVSYSTRFQKPMLHLANRPNGSIEGNGISFTGIRPHGGNKASDTEGCPLIAANSNHAGQVWTSKSDELFYIVNHAILSGVKPLWVIATGCSL